LPGICNNDWDTCVWAHWNQMPGGKALGKKLARADHLGTVACYACHMVLDGQAKRPDHLSLEFVMSAMARAVKEGEAHLRARGLWPDEAALACKPVTVQRIEKAVRTPEQRAARDAERQKRKSREPVRAGHRGLSSRKTTDTTRNNVVSKAIVAGSIDKENAARPRWPKGRKLQSASRLQSRPFGAKQ
jgi:hypothetical protein